MSSTTQQPADIPGFLWDPTRKKYFKDSRELREKLAALCMSSKKEKVEQVNSQQSNWLESLEKEATDISGIRRNPLELLFSRISQKASSNRVSIVNNHTNYGKIIDFLLVENLAWILCSGGILIKSILPQIETAIDENVTEKRVQIQEMIAGLEETSALIHVDIQNGNLIGAINFEKNIIRVLPTENDSPVPEIVLCVRNDIMMNCCEFDSNWNCLIGSKGAFHIVNWSNGVSTKAAFNLQTKSDILSILSNENLVFCGARNGTVSLTDIRNHQHCSFTTSNSSSPVTCLRKSKSEPFDNSIFTGHLDGTIALWDLRFAKAPVISFKSFNKIKPFKFSIVESDVVLAGNDSGLLEAWSVQSGNRLMCVRWNNTAETDNSRPLVAWDWKNRGCWLVNEKSELCIWKTQPHNAPNYSSSNISCKKYS